MRTKPMNETSSSAPRPAEHTPLRLLLVEDEPDLRGTLRYNLKRAGYDVIESENGRVALETIARLEAEQGAPIDLIVSDVMMPGMDGIAFCQALREREATRETPLLFLTAKGEPGDRVVGFRVGADDYLTKPFELEELLARVHVQARRALFARQMRRLLREAEQGEGERADGEPARARPTGDLYAKVVTWEKRFPALAAIRKDSIVGQSPKMLALLREILIRAPGKDPVLISGGTGSGKTGVAEALHKLGPRADKPFRVVSCAELAAADAAITLGKLFGYGKGSGLANVPKDGQPGLLEDADGGTLFLDEIHRLPEQAQSMLLLPVEGRPFLPAVGKGEPKQVDVKFLFATNSELKDDAQEGRFAFDLYQRLSASQIRVPALQERREDITALALHFLDECRDELEHEEVAFAPSLMRHLRERDWPGNVRELRALVREVARRAAFELDAVLTLDHLPDAWRDEAPRLASEEPGLSVTPLAFAFEPGPSAKVPGQNDDSGGFWNEAEMEELSSLRRHRFKIAAAEQELGLSSKSRTLTNHLRGMCFKAMVHSSFDIEKAAGLIIGRNDEALLDRMMDRMGGYMDMIHQHAAAHTTRTLFNNLPRDYRKFVERAIEHERALVPA
jgi:DNA-binding NtrC family response regulator